MNNFSKIIDKFKNLKILVVGDLMLDEYIYGEVNRISPEAPVPILDVKKIDYFPGGAANASRNARALGAGVILVGVIGSKEKGKTLKYLLEKRGINARGLVVEEGRKTTVKSRIIAKSQQVIRMDLEDREPINPETESEILNLVKEQIKNIDAVIISDYAKGVVTPSLAQKIISISRENNILCVVDPKGREFTKYKGCDLITPNVEETAFVLNLEKKSLEDESKFLQAGKMLLSHVMCDNVLITQHSKGMTLFTKEGKIIKYPAVNNKPRDVSGAGDTGIVTIVLSLATGLNLEDSLKIASCACGIAVGKAGTAVVTPEELKESLKNKEIGYSCLEIK